MRPGSRATDRASCRRSRAEHLEDPLSRTIAPSPLRLAIVLPDALAVRLLGDGYPSLQRVSLLALLALLIVAFAGFRRAAGTGVATAATLLLAVSPLQLGMARRALGDSLNTTLWTVSIVLCIEALANDWRRGWLAVAAAFAATLLVKELNLLLLAIGVALVALDAVGRPSGALPARARLHDRAPARRRNGGDRRRGWRARRRRWKT